MIDITNTLVLMVVEMFVPNGNSLKQSWRTESVVTLKHCLQMNQIFAQGGRTAVITVRCEPIDRGLE